LWGWKSEGTISDVGAASATRSVTLSQHRSGDSSDEDRAVMTTAVSAEDSQDSLEGERSQMLNCFHARLLFRTNQIKRSES
jgi:hypothetical protein